MRVFLGWLLVTAAIAGLSDAEWQQAMNGEVPVRIETFTNAAGKSAGRGVGAIIVDKPLAAVWATIARYDDKAEYVPRLEKVEVLERHPDKLRVRQQVDASVTTARYTAWITLDEKTREVHWKLDTSVSDNTIADADGGYHVFELAPTRTLLVYRTYVDSGRSVPRFIQDYMARRSIPDLLRAVKKRVESGGTWKK